MLLAAGACAPAAWGQGAEPQRTDPDATSPAGVIYEIPLDSGRKDGAPHRDGAAGGPGGSANGTGTGGAAGGGTSGGSGGAAGGETPDGTATGSGDGAGAGSSGAQVAAAGGAAAGAGTAASAASSIHSENGFGSSTAVPKAVAAVPKSAAVQGEGSSRLPEYLLLGLLVAVGVYLGCVSFAPRFRT